MTYDYVRDGTGSYALGLAAEREIRIRDGRIAPQTDNERRWAAEGPVDVRSLECLR